ncbi:MAG: hypothetical protein WD768_17695 [Phycisphaeraceae bacterium]
MSFEEHAGIAAAFQPKQYTIAQFIMNDTITGDKAVNARCALRIACAATRR